MSRLHSGLILLQAQGVGEPELYAWDTALPGPDALVPGAVFVLEGHRELLGRADARDGAADGAGDRGSGGGGLHLSGRGDRDVLEMGDSVPAPLTVWLHLPSLMPLRQVLGEPY